MNKKFLSLVLALVMVLGTFGSVFAETKAPEAKDAKKSEVKVPEKKETNEKVQWLVDNGVVAGRTVNKDDKNADLALDKDIQRAEVTKLLIYAIGQQDLAKRLDGVYAPYKDVPSNHWANGLIAAGSTVASPANALPFLHGIGHNMFQPERQVRYDELAKMLVVLVKKDLTKDGLASAKWPTDWMNWAAQLGIFDGIKTPVDGSKAAVRQDAFVMLYNALYRIGQLRNLPTGETMGIISDANYNKLTLNQGDVKKEFTVSNSTNFVPGTWEAASKDAPTVNWVNRIAAGDYYVGSLVRVIADEKGNVSHIIQLGNPKALALDSQGWVGVAQNTVETKVGNKVALGNLSEITFAKDKSLVNNKEVRDDVVVKTNSATRYFVADYSKNQLTEVKDKNAALALIENRRADGYKNVYVGFDTLKNSKLNEAKVVVLGDVDKNNTSEDLVRVVTPGTNKFTATAEKPGHYATKAEPFNLLGWEAGFPLNYGLEKYDVVTLYKNHYDMIIDHDKDNIYKVKSIDTEKIQNIKKVGGRTVEMELTDGIGTRKVDIVSDADLFFGSEIREGAYVQVRFVNKSATTPAVDIVSVVKDTKTRGFLPFGEDSRQVTGTVASIEEFSAGHDGYITFTLKNSDNPYGTLYVARNDAFDEVAKFANLAEAKTKLVGQEITFKAIKSDIQAYKLPMATNILTKAAADKAMENLKKLEDLKIEKLAEIDKLTDLTAEQSTMYKDNIKAADTTTKVNNAVNGATNQNTVNKEAKLVSKVVVANTKISATDVATAVTAEATKVNGSAIKSTVTATAVTATNNVSTVTFTLGGKTATAQVTVTELPA